MSKGKNLLAEAIAEAKIVRETAIKNATKQLEENLTPSIKEMLASKLEEELDLNESDEENIEENSNSGFKEVKVKEPKKKVNEEDEPEEDAEEDEPVDPEADAEDADAAADDADAAAEDAEADAEDADMDAADADAAAEEEEAVDDDTPLKDITLGDLRSIISDFIAASAAPAPGGEEGVDMEPGDVEGMGDENPDAAVDAPVDAPADDTNAVPADNPDVDPAEDDDDEIDISEILKELEEEEKGNKCPECGKDKNNCICKENKANDIMPEDQTGKEHCKPTNANGGKDQDQEISELKKENKELKEGLQKCLNTLKEVNLLNTKLTVTTKLLSKPNLSESQKANVIKTVDGAKTSKEAIALGKTLLEGLRTKKRPITEGRRGTASKPAGKSTAVRKPQMIDENMVHRFQQLAGIIND